MTLARVHALQGELIFDAILADPRDVAIIVSYSGETELLNRVAQTLKGNNIPLLAITNIGTSTLRNFADCVLCITTRERLYSKIATFTTDEAFIYMLDVLYACLFALDYDQNVQLKIASSKFVETERSTTLEILKED